MTDNNSSKVKTILKASYLVISRSILYAILGIVINWTYIFIAVWPVAEKYGASFESLCSGISDAAIGIMINLFIILYFLIFFFLMPFLYFLFGQSTGIKKGMGLAFDLVKPRFYEYITRVAIAAKQKTDARPGAKKTVKRAADSVMKKFEDLPGGIKKIFLFIIDQLPMKEMIEKTAKEVKLSEENFEQSLQTITGLADPYIKEQLLAPSYIMLFVLLAVDVVAVIVTVLIV